MLIKTSSVVFSFLLHGPLLGLHELDAINDQEVKDFRSKMIRISEDRMQKFQTMTCTEWLQACFSPQLEPSASPAVNGGPNDRPADLKVIIHFDQSQVSLQPSAADGKLPKSSLCRRFRDKKKFSFATGVCNNFHSVYRGEKENSPCCDHSHSADCVTGRAPRKPSQRLIYLARICSRD